MKINEVAKLTRISVRTLQHYDAIGLLSPDTVTAAGYRIYSQNNLHLLQQILFFKKLGFPLKKIKEIIESPSFERIEALEVQQQMLQEAQQQIQKILQTIEKTIAEAKGEFSMSNKEKFEGFDFRINAYEQEAKERWGYEKVEEVQKNLTTNYTEKFNTIYEQLATIRHQPPASTVAQEGIHEWFIYLNTIGNYSIEAFAGLGELYVVDERFTKNIDQFGEGLAQFMYEAMIIFAENKKLYPD